MAILISTGNDNDLFFQDLQLKFFKQYLLFNTKAFKKFKLNSKIVALSCSSHRGETYHIKELEKWLKKIGINKKKLKCGVHYPLNSKSMKIFKIK